jgi:hypothetical protein
MNQFKDSMPAFAAPYGLTRRRGRIAAVNHHEDPETAVPTPARSGLSWLRRLAGGCLVLMLVVTSASAWLRLGQARPVCADWPSCRVDPPRVTLRAPQARPSSETAVVRGVHRAAASTVLVLLLLLLALLRRHGGVSRGARPLVVALLALALGLSALGIVTPGSRSVAVVLGNLFGGFGMLALAWALLRRLAAAPALGPRMRTLAGIVAVLWLAQAALGAWSGTAPPQGTVAPQVHLLLGVCAATAAGMLGLLARGTVRRVEGTTLALLSLLQFVLGALAVGYPAAPAVVLLHNLGAATGLALLTGMALAHR